MFEKNARLINAAYIGSLNSLGSKGCGRVPWKCCGCCFPAHTGPEVLRTRDLEGSGAFNSPVFENGAPSKWKIGLFLGFWDGSVRDLWAIPMLSSRPGPRLGASFDPRFGRKHGH